MTRLAHAALCTIWIVGALVSSGSGAGRGLGFARANAQIREEKDAQLVMVAPHYDSASQELDVFVSGLREFLGEKAGRLKVTYLAKWKTTAQMVAIPVLLLAGVFEWDRRHNTPWVSDWFHDWVGWILSNGGLLLIWVAGILTLLTGYDYLMKAMPFLKDRKR